MSDDGRKWDSKIKIVILAGPSGTRRLVQSFIKGFSTGLNVSEDGNTFSATVESRNAIRIVGELRKLYRADQVDIEFTGAAASMGIDTKNPPAISPDGDYTGLAAGAGPGPAGAPKPTDKVPDHVLYKQKGEAADPDPAAVPQDVEGTQGAPWPYGPDYRPMDDDKLSAMSRKERSRKEGKAKIQLGVRSDLQFLVEPNRDGGPGIWKVCELTASGERHEIVRADSWGLALKGLRDALRARFLVKSFKVAPDGGAPAVSTTPTPTPAAAPTPTVYVSATAPAPAQQAPIPGFTMFTLLRDHAGSRWAFRSVNGLVVASGDDLEDVFKRAHDAAAGTGMLVVGWDGRLPTAPRVTPEEAQAKIEAQLQAQLQAAIEKRIDEIKDENGDIPLEAALDTIDGGAAP